MYNEFEYNGKILHKGNVAIGDVTHSVKNLQRLSKAELNALGVNPVALVPTITSNQVLEFNGGSIVDGEWVRFTVKEKTAETLMAEIRAKRNQLLADTDWTALVDSTLTDEMKTYRQALRDLPETVDVNNPVYPEKP